MIIRLRKYLPFSIMFLAFLIATSLGSNSSNSIYTSNISPSYLIYTSNLDPSPIAYPNDWYSNIIDLSSNHAGQMVTLTIYCNLIQNLYPNTYVTVIIPGFSPQPTPITLSAIQPGQYDNVFNFTSVALPSIAGAYGPISIFIYSQCVSSTYGDILASASAYGSIQILSAKLATETVVLSYNAATVALSLSVGVVLHSLYQLLCMLTIIL
jgi:hypothetical protein